MFAASVSTLSLTLRFHRQDYVALPYGWNLPLMIDEGEGALTTMIGRPLQELARPTPRTFILALAGPRLVLHFEGRAPEHSACDATGLDGPSSGVRNRGPRLAGSFPGGVPRGG